MAKGGAADDRRGLSVNAAEDARPAVARVSTSLLRMGSGEEVDIDRADVPAANEASETAAGRSRYPRMIDVVSGPNKRLIRLMSYAE